MVRSASMAEQEKRQVFGREAYDSHRATVSAARLAHKEVVASLEWLERGQLQIALDRLHLAYRLIGEQLAREGIVEREEEDNDY